MGNNMPAACREITFRDYVVEGDIGGIRRLVTDAGVFSPAEVEMALELVNESLAKGSVASGYFFILAEDSGDLIGYICFGPIPCSNSGFDAYWLAVDRSRRRGGVGHKLFQAAEQEAFKLGGKKMYIETSSRREYEPAHALYLKLGYEKVAALEDFYAIGDHKFIYTKKL